MKKGRIILYFVCVIAMFSYNFYFRPIKGNPLVNDDYRKSKAYVNDLYVSDEHFKKSLLKQYEYDAYYAVIESSLKDEIDISIPCSSECPSMGVVRRAVILDHPELISYQWGMTCRISSDKKMVNCKNRDNLNPVTTFFGSRRIEREMEIIRKETKEMSDKEKIIYVYDYVSSHEYDHYFTHSHSNQSAYSFFTKGSTVCAGFAKVSQLIFQNIGIKSYLAWGSNHMWNYVEYEGKYYVFDSTMGACFIYQSPHYYDGLGMTTVGEVNGDYMFAYPEIEEKPLKELFDL